MVEKPKQGACSSRTPPAAVPDGWVLVPRDPTPEMLLLRTND